MVEGAKEAELFAAGVVEGRWGCGLECFHDVSEMAEVVEGGGLDDVAKENDEWQERGLEEGTKSNISIWEFGLYVRYAVHGQSEAVGLTRLCKFLQSFGGFEQW